MNWRLLALLSLFAAAMGIGTVFVIPSKIEPLFWLPIFVVCAYVIAKRAPGRPFLHGFVLALFNCVWITTTHVVFAATYLARHPDEAAMNAKAPLPPQVMMLLVGPVIGVVSGVVQGLFALVASKLVSKSAS